MSDVRTFYSKIRHFILKFILHCNFLSGVTVRSREWFRGRHGAAVGHADRHVYTHAAGTRLGRHGPHLHRDVRRQHRTRRQTLYMGKM